MLYYFFEIFHSFLDKYFHQNKILFYLKYKLKKKINIVLDVGSHKGESIDMFLSFFPIKKIHSFEPQKKIFNTLKKKYLYNKKICLNNFALGKKKECRKLNTNILSSSSTLSKINYKSPHAQIKSLILKKKSGFCGSEIIRVIKLDDYCLKRKIKKIDLLKIDVEGFELNVLSGFKQLIKYTKIIIIEINGTDYYKGYSSNKIEQMLSRNYFKLYKRIKFPFMEYFDCIYINKNYF